MTRTDNIFEYNVLRIACFFGLVRSVIEVSRDLLAEKLEPNFYLDLAFIIVFGLTLIALNAKFPFKRILYLFYVPFIVLLTIMFIDGNGLVYSIENNLFAGLLIISLTMRNRLTLYYISAFILCVLFGLAVVEYQHNFFDTFQPINNGNFNFIFSSVGIVAFTLYAKTEFGRKRKELSKAMISLNQRNDELRSKNKELLEQKDALEELTENVDNQVRNKSSRIKSQKRQVEQYLSITMTELFDAFQKTVKCIDDIDQKKEEDQLMDMMVQSGENLKQEMEGLRIKIEEGMNEVH